MATLVTGATGFVGRHLVRRLVARGGRVVAIVRPQSLERARALFAGTPVELLAGELELPLLGVDPDRAGPIEQLFHLAALYDLTAPAAAVERASGLGTTNALALAGALGAHCFHHLSSVAVAGDHRGTFSELDFDLGQSFPTGYHRAKFEAERVVRSQTLVPWRIYRPSIVVGHSQTGEMDKVDGPTTSSRRSRGRATCCPNGCRSSAPSWATRTSSRSTSSPPRSTTSRTFRAATARRST